MARLLWLEKALVSSVGPFLSRRHRHFKRGLAALSPHVVTPRRWGTALPPCVCRTSAQWEGVFGV